MGSTCCVPINNKEVQAETFILFNLSRLQSQRRSSFQEISEIFRGYFGIDPLDIEGSPLKWITKEAYDNYMINFINDAFKSQITSLDQIDCPSKYFFLPYSSSSLHIYLPSYNVNFHLFILIWIIGILNFPMKEKILIIKQIIIKSQKILTYSTFSTFLMTYMSIFLIEITQQFLLCSEINLNAEGGLIYLIDNIFNTSNVEAYCSLFKNQIKLLIVKTKKIYINEKNINNTFISEKELGEFFDEYPFILNAQELREHFYDQFDVSSVDQVIKGNMCN